MTHESPATTNDSTPTDTDRIVIPVVAEQLVVGTRVVEGHRGVRVHKAVHVDTVRFDQPLASETVEVQRVPIGRRVESAVDVRYDGDTTIVPVVEERLVWTIERVLVEEIHITRRSTVRHATDEVDLRREEVTVERFDDGSPNR